MTKRSRGGKDAGKTDDTAPHQPQASSDNAPASLASWREKIRASAALTEHAALRASSIVAAPSRWEDKLSAAEARANASAAKARAAEEQAQVAAILVRQLGKKVDAAETRAREMESRALTAEAAVTRLQEAKRDAPPASPSRPLDDDERRQFEAAKKAVSAANERARKAEMWACDMEGRALAAEAIIAGNR